ncbi:phosphatidate cytidylyltransferase [Methylosarcina fibrata]|uniref:phosphatidate cytidylyltransferase n=1 Tax=Methylosarcina fibrata TaxID=105972 RepID=UPI00037B6A66|nr:phosphatidate cytidylyltransferase [Methylosarcina fibrata]
MLLQRVITAIVLAALIGLAVFLLPADYFSLVLALIALLGAWEWTKLIGMDSALQRSLFFLALIVPMLGIHFWTQFLQLLFFGFEKLNLGLPDVRYYSGVLEWLVIPPILFWILAMVLIRKLPSSLLRLDMKLCYQALIGWFVLLAAWMFLSRLRALYGTELAMYLLVLIWAADIAAYFTGKKWGKTQLAPEISPGKTVEGVYGALIAAVLCGIALDLIFKVYNSAFIIAADFVFLSVITVLISIYGDLFFSLVKRRRGVKDSGSILPGHGGILDRIDSLIAAIPIFYGGVYLIYGLVS